MAVDIEAVREQVGPAVQRADYTVYWRSIATALSFALFGFGALVVSGVCAPILRLCYGSRSVRPMRRLIQRGMRLFVAFMHRVGVLTYDVRGIEQLGRSGQLILANHPSLIDVVFLLAFTPQPTCIVKQAMFRNPLTRSTVLAAGYVSNENAAQMIEAASAALVRGETLVLFPEGTRTVPGMPLLFHRGAANIAVRSARVVTPVYIQCLPATLFKGEPWYRIPPQRIRFSVVVGQDLDVGNYRTRRSVPLASRAFNEALKAHFDSQLDEIYSPGGSRQERPAA